MIQKRERSFKWCITNYNFSSTTHSLDRKRRQSGFYLFCFVLRVTLSETFTKTRKKRLRKWLICESLFFSWSHDVVRCCGNCPKYSFCFFCFFRGTKFYGQSIIHLYRAANFFVVFFLIFWFSEKYTIKCGVFCCCKKTWEIIIFWRRIWNDWE